MKIHECLLLFCCLCRLLLLIMVIIIFKPFRLKPPTPEISVAENEEIDIEFLRGYQPKTLRLEQWIDVDNSKVIEINKEDLY